MGYDKEDIGSQPTGLTTGFWPCGDVVALDGSVLSHHETTNTELCVNETDPKTWTVTLDDINVHYDTNFK